MKEKLFAATSADTLRAKCDTGHPAPWLLRSTWVGAWEADEASKAPPVRPLREGPRLSRRR